MASRLSCKLVRISCVANDSNKKKLNLKNKNEIESLNKKIEVLKDENEKLVIKDRENKKVNILEVEALKKEVNWWPRSIHDSTNFSSKLKKRT